MIAFAPIWIVAAVSLGKGIAWLIRNELARRRFPPMRVLEVQDEIPFCYSFNSGNVVSRR